MRITHVDHDTNKNIYELLSSKSLLLEGGEYSGRHGICYILLSPETSDGLGLGVETHSLHRVGREKVGSLESQSNCHLLPVKVHVSSEGGTGASE